MNSLQQIERNLELAYGQYLNSKIQLVSEKEKTKCKMTKTEAADILDSIETQRLKENYLKGSQINGGNSDYGRVESDFYPTPAEATQALLNYLKIPKGTHVWEPACGEGHMASVLESNGYKVTSTDLNECCGRSGVDFLDTDLTDYKDCKWIITNPPFKISEGFIRKAWGFNLPFALLLKSQYWHSKTIYL